MALTKDRTKAYNTIHPGRDKERILKVSKIENRSQKIRNKNASDFSIATTLRSRRILQNSERD